MSKYGIVSGPYFPVFELKMEIYVVNFRIQSEYRKIRARNNSVFRHISRSVRLPHVIVFVLILKILFVQYYPKNGKVRGSKK